MSKQFCSECGNEITETSKFCTSCGHPISAPGEPQQQVNTVPPVQQAPPTGQPPHGVKPNNKNMIYVIIAGIIAIGLFVFYSQKDAPEDVAEKFFSYVMEFDVKKAEKLISSDADSSVKEEFREISEGLDSLPIEFSGQMKMKHTFKVLNVDKSGKKATVHAEISFLNGEFEEEAYFELQKEKGQWKVMYVE